MKVIYTNSPQKPRPNEVYRLLNQFFGVVSGATSVQIDGDAPHIEQAYRAAGITVTNVEAIAVPESIIRDVGKAEAEEVDLEQPAVKALDDMSVTKLQAYLTELGVEFDPKAKKADLLKLAKEQ